MNRTIPGTTTVEGREFLYVEILDETILSDLVDDVLSACGTLPLPKSGGIIEEKTQIIRRNGASYLGFSYKGDLEGWRNKVVNYCLATQRKWASIYNGDLVISDGTHVPLAECKANFMM